MKNSFLDGAEDHEGRELPSWAQRTPDLLTMPAFLKIVALRPSRLQRWFSTELAAYMTIGLCLICLMVLVFVISLPAVLLGNTGYEVVEPVRVGVDVVVCVVFFLFVLGMDYLVMRVSGSGYREFSCLWGRTRDKVLKNFSDIQNIDGTFNLRAYSVRITGVADKVREPDLRQILEKNFGAVHDVVIIRLTGEACRLYSEANDMRQRIIEANVKLAHPKMAKPKLKDKIVELEVKYDRLRETIRNLHSNNDSNTYVAYVTFVSEDSAVKAKSANEDIMRKVQMDLSSPEMRIFSAPMPSDLIWQNIDQDNLSQKVGGLLFCYGVVFIGLTILVVSIYLSNYFANVFLVPQALGIIVLSGYLFVFILIPILQEKLVRRPLYSQQERDMLWLFTVFQFLSSSLVPIIVFGAYRITFFVVFQGLLIDAVVINVLLEYIIPRMVRNSKRKYAYKLWTAMHEISKSTPEKINFFQSGDEQLEFLKRIEKPEVHEDFGFSFRFSFMVKTVLVSMFFSSAYPLVTVFSILHLVFQYVVDLVNLKHRYKQCPKIPFPSCSMVVVRYLLLAAPCIKLFSGMAVYLRITKDWLTILPLFFLFWGLFTTYCVLTVSDVVAKIRRTQVFVRLGLRDLEPGRIAGSYRAPERFRTLQT